MSVDLSAKVAFCAWVVVTLQGILNTAHASTAHSHSIFRPSDKHWKEKDEASLADTQGTTRFPLLLFYSIYGPDPKFLSTCVNRTSIFNNASNILKRVKSNEFLWKSINEYFVFIGAHGSEAIVVQEHNVHIRV